MVEDGWKIHFMDSYSTWNVIWQAQKRSFFEHVHFLSMWLANVFHHESSHPSFCHEYRLLKSFFKYHFKTTFSSTKYYTTFSLRTFSFGCFEPVCAEAENDDQPTFCPFSTSHNPHQRLNDLTISAGVFSIPHCKATSLKGWPLKSYSLLQVHNSTFCFSSDITELTIVQVLTAGIREEIEPQFS